ncbi:MAG: DUF4389 domain-containing protein [Myxococcota bacterium]
MTDPSPTYADRGHDEIERRDTAARALLTILFWIVHSVVDSVIGLVVIFSLVWTAITRRPPSERLRVLANRIITYDYRIGRYLTYNDSPVPFPFSDFPAPIEEGRWSPDLRETDVLGFGRDRS